MVNVKIINKAVYDAEHGRVEVGRTVSVHEQVAKIWEEKGCCEIEAKPLDVEVDTKVITTKRKSKRNSK